MLLEQHSSDNPARALSLALDLDHAAVSQQFALGPLTHTWLIIGACKGEAGGMQHESQMPGSPPDVASDLVTSGNIVQLDQFTFYPSIADGRVSAWPCCS